MIDRLFLIELRRLLLSAVGLIERRLELAITTAQLWEQQKKTPAK